MFRSSFFPRTAIVRSAFVAILLTATFALPAAKAQADADLTGEQIRDLVRRARTVHEFTVLADYYQTQSRIYRKKASAAMHLWAERNAVISPICEKWPRPVDSARNMHDYYEHMAQDAIATVLRYNRLADSAPYE